MTKFQSRSALPLFRLPIVIPTNWCTVCQLTIRSEDEYSAHIRQFPYHHIKPITKLVCGKCGGEVGLENGHFAEHWTGSYSSMSKCPGSGLPA